LYVSCRDCHIAQAGFSDLFAGLRELSISSFELDVPRDLSLTLEVDGLRKRYLLTEAEDLRSLRRLLEEAGASVCALLLRNDFGSKSVDDEVSYVVKACEAGKVLGADVARIDSTVGEHPELSSERQAKLAAGPIKRVLDRVEGARLAPENHGFVANTREFLDALFQNVASDRLGLTLDPGNLYWYGYSLSEVMTMVDHYASNVKHTHMKNGRALEATRETRRQPGQIEMTPIYQGDIDLGMVVAMLRRAGYGGDLTVEDESLAGYPAHQARQILGKDLQHLTSMIE